MTIDSQKAREMFLHAVGKLPMESWGQYVVQECGGDDDLRQHVEHLLQVHRDAGSFLDTPAVAIGETVPDHQPRPELAGTVIGPFTLIEKIGEGGMGIVYAAEQTSLSRRVALKILPSASLWSANALERFRKEVRITAALEHPNIVPIYEMGYE